MKKKQRKKKKPTKVVGARVDSKTYTFLEQESEKLGKTISDIIREQLDRLYARILKQKRVKKIEQKRERGRLKK